MREYNPILDGSILDGNMIPTASGTQQIGTQAIPFAQVNAGTVRGDYGYFSNITGGGTLNITAVPGDHTASGLILSLTAHQTLAFGDACYINSDGEAQIIDADAIGTMSCIVMCADNSIVADNPGNFLLIGIARDDSWNWTVGGLVYGTVTGTTGNTLSQVAPSGTNDVTQIFGVATHADRMYFNPQLSQVEHA